MATSTEKGSIILESIIFFYIVATIIFFLKERDHKYKYEKTKSTSFTQSKNLEGSFIHSEKIKELQDTQIKSLKEYEVK